MTRTWTRLDAVKRVRVVAWGVLLALAAMQAWVFRHTISPDGIAYLDLSDALLHGRLGELVNAYWSPLYPSLIGLVRLLVSATPLGAPYWEFALLHLVNFIGFALSLAAFEWLLRTLDDAGIRWWQQPILSPVGRGAAYLLFGTASLGMISVAAPAPDFFLSAAVLAAFACMFRLRDAPANHVAAVRLGIILAAGALTKSIMFPLGTLMLATLALAIWRHGGRMTVARATAVFVLATLPWCVAVSLSLGRPSTGASGSLNYAWYVNNQEPLNSGVLPRLAAPPDSLPLPGLAVFPDARGTDPHWYDPQRWHRDKHPSFSLAQQWRRLSWSLRYYVYVTAPLLLALVAIGGASDWRDIQTTIRRGYGVILPSLAALAAYALVYTLSRYAAPFLVALCVTLAAVFPRDATLRPARFGVGVALSLVVIEAAAPLRAMVIITYGLATFIAAWIAAASRQPWMRWLISCAAVLLVWVLPLMPPIVARAMPIMLGLLVWRGVARSATRPDGIPAAAIRRALAMGAVVAFAVPGIANALSAVARWRATPAASVHPHWNVAQQMVRDGIPIGSRIALVGIPATSGWARLARYRIVAIIPDSQKDAFGNLSAADRNRIMRAFAAAGATHLVIRPEP
ncbi:MAG: hypothetical protein WD825_12525 [Gemmatimonadaceae bacterium]